MSEAIETNKYSITLEKAKELVQLLEAGEQEKANAILTTVYRQAEHSMFQEVGVLTRDLHDAIYDFVDNPRIKTITSVEIAAATDRLRYIIQMTENAANRTLDAVDACTPMASSLIKEIDDIMPLWNQLMRGHIDKHAFVKLCHHIDELLSLARKDAEELSNKLNEILMAQDYQDLTGQMIQKVIGLVGELEDKLVKFLLKVAPYVQQEHHLKEAEEQAAEEAAKAAEGPIPEPQKQAKHVAENQDEVDDILATLGF